MLTSLVNLTSANLWNCDKITGKELSSTLLLRTFCGPVRAHLSAKVLLTSLLPVPGGLYSGDLGTLAGLTDANLFNCDKITGEELSSTLLLRTSLRGNFRELSADTSFIRSQKFFF